MSTFFALIQKDIMEFVRSRRLLVLFGFFILMGISSPVLAKLTPELLKSVGTGQSGIEIIIPDPSSKDAVAQYIKNLGGLGVLLLIFLTAGLIAEEKSKRTLEMVLVKPLERRTFITAKIVVLTTSLLLGNILSAILCIVYTNTLFPEFDTGKFIMVAFALAMYLVTISLITISASTVAKSGLAASGIGIGIYATLETTPMLLPRFKEYLPSYILSSYPELMASGWNQAHTNSLLASVLLIATALTLSIILFNRQEVDR